MFILGATSLFFPIIGSFLVQHIGFRKSLDLMSFLLLLNSIIYLMSTVFDWRKEKNEPVTLIFTTEEEEEERRLL